MKNIIQKIGIKWVLFIIYILLLSWFVLVRGFFSGVAFGIFNGAMIALAAKQLEEIMYEK